MNIIQKQPNESGAYGQVYHSFSGLDPNEYREITADMTNYCAWNSFIIPTVTDDKVTSYVCNTKAWNAWQAAHPEPTPEPTTEERISVLETLVLELGGVI